MFGYLWISEKSHLDAPKQGLKTDEEQKSFLEIYKHN